MNIDVIKFKGKLEEEKKTIEDQLQTIGVKSSRNPSEWEASRKDLNDDEPSDRTETAEAITEYEAEQSIVSSLDTQLLEINNALDRIENGTYGTCKTCGKEIETDRLTANPSASTCKADMNS
ncbi:MAG: TraR/DksA C4-type zinc finger protein [Patescibacteria group bacterium]